MLCSAASVHRRRRKLKCLLYSSGDHFQYVRHSCEVGVLKDVQVPVCPLCAAPVPGRRGDPPDIVVSAHIDNDCQTDAAKQRRNKVCYHLSIYLFLPFWFQSFFTLKKPKVGMFHRNSICHQLANHHYLDFFFHLKDPCLIFSTFTFFTLSIPACGTFFQIVCILLLLNLSQVNSHRPIKVIPQTRDLLYLSLKKKTNFKNRTPSNEIKHQCNNNTTTILNWS